MKVYLLCSQKLFFKINNFLFEAFLLELVLFDDLATDAVSTRQYYLFVFVNAGLRVTGMLFIDLRGAESFVDASISIGLAFSSLGLTGNVQCYFLPFAV